MTYEEAIKMLSRLARIRSDGYFDYLANGGKSDDNFDKEMMAFDLAIDALKKQMPRKPNLKIEQTSPFSIDDVPYCPTCNCSVPWIETSVFYCENCGQAIDWGVSE